ncbi:shikimate dehydrogenase [Sphingomonas kaistensis]|uniref:Shikimate dehydrogenase n=1 Tax=Sphingomonas kaistensis TaxID=298708 RepID=A0ABZ2G0X6_9SPHN
MTSDIPYAEVIGDPVSHSKSPVIHNFWLGKLGLEGEYRATRVLKDEIEHYLHERRGDPLWRGCNVTMPLKELAAKKADALDQHAGRIGAINTLIPRNSGQKIVGYNTDWIAIRDLVAPLLATPKDVVVSMLGTGGAARAAVYAVRSVREPLFFYTYARTLIQAVAFRSKVGLPEDYAAGDLKEFCSIIGPFRLFEAASLIINATPLGSADAAPLCLELEAEGDIMLLDMVTNPAETELVTVARQAGINVATGFDMLIEQAAAAFLLLFGHEAPREYDTELRTLLTA